MEINHHDNPMPSLFATVLFAMVSVFLRFINFISDVDKAVLEPMAHFGSICASCAAVISFFCMVYPPFKEAIFDIIHSFKNKKP